MFEFIKDALSSNDGYSCKRIIGSFIVMNAVAMKWILFAKLINKISSTELMANLQNVNDISTGLIYTGAALIGASVFENLTIGKKQ